MKGSIFAVVAVASGLVSAQFAGVPACAQPCLVSAISAVGCPVTDVGCQCSSTAAIQQAGTGCILGACTKEGELQSAIAGGLALCTAFLAGATGSSTVELTTTLKSTATETSTITVQTSDIPSPTPASNGTTTASSTITSAPVLGSATSSTRSGTATSATSQVPVGAGSKVAAVGLGGVGAVVLAMLAL